MAFTIKGIPIPSGKSRHTTHLSWKGVSHFTSCNMVMRSSRLWHFHRNCQTMRNKDSKGTFCFSSDICIQIETHRLSEHQWPFKFFFMWFFLIMILENLDYIMDLGKHRWIYWIRIDSYIWIPIVDTIKENPLENQPKYIIHQEHSKIWTSESEHNNKNILCQIKIKITAIIISHA